jgi:hypothetical protein
MADIKGLLCTRKSRRVCRSCFVPPGQQTSLGLLGSWRCNRARMIAFCPPQGAPIGIDRRIMRSAFYAPATGQPAVQLLYQWFLQRMKIHFSFGTAHVSSWPSKQPSLRVSSGIHGPGVGWSIEPDKVLANPSLNHTFRRPRNDPGPTWDSLRAPDDCRRSARCVARFLT